MAFEDVAAVNPLVVFLLLFLQPLSHLLLIIRDTRVMSKVTHVCVHSVCKKKWAKPCGNMAAYSVKRCQFRT